MNGSEIVPGHLKVLLQAFFPTSYVYKCDNCKMCVTSWMCTVASLEERWQKNGISSEMYKIDNIVVAQM